MKREEALRLFEDFMVTHHSFKPSLTKYGTINGSAICDLCSGRKHKKSKLYLKCKYDRMDNEAVTLKCFRASCGLNSIKGTCL